MDVPINVPSANKATAVELPSSTKLFVWGVYVIVSVFRGFKTQVRQVGFLFYIDKKSVHSFSLLDFGHSLTNKKNKKITSFGVYYPYPVDTYNAHHTSVPCGWHALCIYYLCVLHDVGREGSMVVGEGPQGARLLTHEMVIESHTVWLHWEGLVVAAAVHIAFPKSKFCHKKKVGRCVVEGVGRMFGKVGPLPVHTNRVVRLTGPRSAEIDIPLYSLASVPTPLRLHLFGGCLGDGGFFVEFFLEAFSVLAEVL